MGWELAVRGRLVKYSSGQRLLGWQLLNSLNKGERYDICTSTTSRI